MAIAHEAGRKVAFTLSDIACIKPHRAEMMAMLEAGAVDLLFANENEIARAGRHGRPRRGDRGASGQGAVDRRHLRRRRARWRSSSGRRASVPIARIGTGVVDTTGAGDLFAAGFLVGQAQGAAWSSRCGSARSRRRK